jgi:hypothetical protein
MSRKTDTELLAELKQQNRERDDDEEAEEADRKKYSAVPMDEEADSEEEKPKNRNQPSVQVVEREVNLSLLNDKLNFIISKIQNLK